MITLGVSDELDGEVAASEPGPASQTLLEAQARVFITGLLRNAKSALCECEVGASSDEAKREITIQIRRARKLAQDEAARYIALCLDFDTPCLPNTLSPDLLQALKRVFTLAKMCRGPDE